MTRSALLAALLALTVNVAHAAPAAKPVDKAAEKKTANVVSTKEAAAKADGGAVASHMKGLDSEASMTIIDGSNVGSSLMGAKKNF